MYHILYQIFNDIKCIRYFECIIKKHETLTYNPPMKIYISKIENTITFIVKTRYYLEL